MPDVPVYVGVAGPTDPAALLRYAQRCGVSVSLRALRNLGSGIAQLVTNTDPRDHLVSVARYTLHARAEQRGRRAPLQLRRRRAHRRLDARAPLAFHRRAGKF